MIDRLEERLVDGFDLESGEYTGYIQEIRKRLANVKTYLLTDKQREFYHHAMTEYDNRTLWFQSICYTILDQRLDAIRDEQEDKLADDLVYFFESVRNIPLSLRIQMRTTIVMPILLIW